MIRAALLALLGGMAMVGCAFDQTKYSDTLSEPGTVEDSVYTPATHGSGTGMTMKGTLVFTSVDTQPVYATVFGCQHGKFIIYGRQLWERVKRGQSGTIYYREVYRCNHDGGDCHLVDYDFLRFEAQR